MEDQKEEALLTLDDALQILGTSRPTLYRLLNQGDIKGLKVGRQWRFRRAELIAYMERGPVALAAPPMADLDRELAFFAAQLRETSPATAESPESDSADAESKTIRLVHQMIRLALDLHASDIHWEPTQLDGEAILLLRIRRDGVLQEIRRLPGSLYESVIISLKTMAKMNIAEQRSPQHGRIPIRRGEDDFDFRVSIVPTMFGETMTIRILDKSSIILGLNRLGLWMEEEAAIHALMNQPNGLVLIVGPAGAGLTTTAYSCLQLKASPEIKTLSVELPVEYVLPYMTQVQAHPSAGFMVPDALREFQRQDPDIIFIGGLQDTESAHLAADAALNGHLILAVLHAADAPSALCQLLDMSIPPFLVAGTVVGVIAQRLCRTICPDCKESYESHARDLARYGLIPENPDQTITLSRGRGCAQCRQRGYRGRTAIFSLLTMTGEIKDLIVRAAPRTEIADAARAGGMVTLQQAGLRKVMDGITTPEEVMRVVFSAE